MVRFEGVYQAPLIYLVQNESLGAIPRASTLIWPSSRGAEKGEAYGVRVVVGSKDPEQPPDPTAARQSSTLLRPLVLSAKFSYFDYRSGGLSLECQRDLTCLSKK